MTSPRLTRPDDAEDQRTPTAGSAATRTERFRAKWRAVEPRCKGVSSWPYERAAALETPKSAIAVRFSASRRWRRDKTRRPKPIGLAGAPGVLMEQ